YHEALVHPAMATAASRRRVVIGGGGDGLTAREVLKWPDVERVTVVDLDREVTDLAATYPPLRALNADSFPDARVRVVTDHAMRFFAAREHGEPVDVVLLDFPDPSTYSVGKLYTKEMYAAVRRRLAPGGALVVQSSSPLLSRSTFWCIAHTLEAAGFV